MVPSSSLPLYRLVHQVFLHKFLLIGGLALFGNLFPNLTMYKVNKLFGKESITWLDPDTYRDSKYIYELERGEND